MAASNAGRRLLWIVVCGWIVSRLDIVYKHEAIPVSGDLHLSRLVFGLSYVYAVSKFTLDFLLHSVRIWLCAHLSFAPCHGLIISHSLKQK